MPPVPVQVVFQGGGARLCPMMAVCEVLQKFETDQRITISRVAGSSAGAIAAVMLASKKPIADYKLILRTIAETKLPFMNVSKFKGAWNVYWGQPWFKSIRLFDIFNTSFCENGGPQYIDKLPITTNLYTTDLYTLSSKLISGSESIPQALAKSCNFPFAFIGASSDQTDVDGGLALNLPVDSFQRDRALGEVIAISFQNVFVERTGNRLISFAKNLFSASIQSGVERSKLLIGEQNVFSIDTDIDTFDFHKIMTDGLTKHYNKARKAFMEWFPKWLAPYERTPRTQSSHFVRATVGDLRPALIRQIDYDINEISRVKIKEIFISDIAIIDENSNFTGRYRTDMSMSLEILIPTNVLQMDFEIGAGGLFSDAHLLCAASSSSREIPFTARVQQLGEVKDGLRFFRLYYYFDEQLMPKSGEVIALQYQYEADDPYPKFGTGKEVSAISPKLGDTEIITLVAAFPRKQPMHPAARDLASLSEAEQEAFGVAGWAGRLVPSEGVEFATIAGRTQLDRAVSEYHVVVRRACGVKKGEGCGFAIE